MYFIFSLKNIIVLENRSPLRNGFVPRPGVCSQIKRTRKGPRDNSLLCYGSSIIKGINKHHAGISSTARRQTEIQSLKSRSLVASKLQSIWRQLSKCLVYKFRKETASSEDANPSWVSWLTSVILALKCPTRDGRFKGGLGCIDRLCLTNQQPETV